MKKKKIRPFLLIPYYFMTLVGGLIIAGSIYVQMSISIVNSGAVYVFLTCGSIFLFLGIFLSNKLRQEIIKERKLQQFRLDEDSSAIAINIMTKKTVDKIINALILISFLFYVPFLIVQMIGPSSSGATVFEGLSVLLFFIGCFLLAISILIKIIVFIVRKVRNP